MAGIDEDVPKVRKAVNCSGFPPFHKQDILPFLAASIEAMKKAQDKLDRGEEYHEWDCGFCDLQSSINVAEMEQIMRSYLYIDKRECVR